MGFCSVLADICRFSASQARLLILAMSNPDIALAASLATSIIEPTQRGFVLWWLNLHKPKEPERNRKLALLSNIVPVAVGSEFKEQQVYRRALRHWKRKCTVAVLNTQGDMTVEYIAATVAIVLQACSFIWHCRVLCCIAQR